MKTNSVVASVAELGAEMGVESDQVTVQTAVYLQEILNKNFCRTDRFFSLLMPAQWIGGIITALVVSPKSWDGVDSTIHIHVWAAIILGGLISLLPTLLAIYQPGTVMTRQIITVGQMLTSSLLIHLCGGRLETHFHIFGSLALLAFYRDAKVFHTATLVTLADHLIRGFYFPYSVFGVSYASPWRAVEHGCWVLFEVGCLLWSCKTSNDDSREVAHRRAIEQQQRHTQKLESIGQLAAGIAHEINTPIQFVGDNVRFLKQEFLGLKELFAQCSAVKNGTSSEAELMTCAGAVDSEYLQDEIPKAIDQSLEGISRITKIVSAMKEFSHPSRTEKQVTDINKAIESTVVVSTNEWKYLADLDLKLDSSLPLVPCVVGEFNQVILNLIVNAAHAIADVKEKGPTGKGRITVQTKNLTDKVEIRIRDTGAGIPADVAQKIFDPFFTTKEVGKGTGQGLSIARSIILGKHGGTINFESKVGQGTTFIITLPFQESAVTGTEIESEVRSEQTSNVLQ